MVSKHKWTCHGENKREEWFTLGKSRCNYLNTLELRHQPPGLKKPFILCLVLISRKSFRLFFLGGSVGLVFKFFIILIINNFFHLFYILTEVSPPFSSPSCPELSPAPSLPSIPFFNSISRKGQTWHGLEQTMGCSFFFFFDSTLASDYQAWVFTTQLTILLKSLPGSQPPTVKTLMINKQNIAH